MRRFALGLARTAASGAIAGLERFVEATDRANETSGTTHWCTAADLEAMGKAGLVGFDGDGTGSGTLLGRWPDGRHLGKAVRAMEAWPTLCLAPSGAGKTLGLVVPNLVSCPGTSYVVHDPKPELFRMTSGHRATTSHVVALDWSRLDDPDEGVFHPRFNFLSPGLVPAEGPDRDDYLDMVAKCLVPDAKDGGRYFVNKGRTALAGFMHALVARVGDAGDHSGLPERWVGREHSLPMLVDWIAQAEFEAAGFEASESSLERNEGNPRRDVLGEWLRDLCASLDPAKSGQGRSRRALEELEPLTVMGERERAGVMGTVGQGLILFKNEAVRQRTSACDFTPDDVRGVLNPALAARAALPPGEADRLDPDGEAFARLRDDPANWRPLTLYLCGNERDGSRTWPYSVLSGLLVEVIQSTLANCVRGGDNPRTGRRQGPFPVCVLLDEFGGLPRLNGLARNLELGRAKAVRTVMIGQSWSQVEAIYGKEEAERIGRLAGCTVVFAQNDPETARRLTEWREESWRGGVSGSSREGEPAWEAEDGLGRFPFAPARGAHLVVLRMFRRVGLRLRTPFPFVDDEVGAKVRDERTGEGPKPAERLPEHLRARRRQEAEGRKKTEDRGR